MPNSIPYKACAIILALGQPQHCSQPQSKASVDGMLFSQKISASPLEAGVRDIVLADAEDTVIMQNTKQLQDKD